jgi:hypothetical protein
VFDFGDSGKAVSAWLQSPLTFDKNMPKNCTKSKDQLIAFHNIAKRVFLWYEEVIDGMHDTSLKEISQNMSKAPPRAKFTFPRMRMDSILLDYERGLLDASHAHAAASTVHDESTDAHDERRVAALQVAAMRRASDASAQRAAKEESLLAARARHADSMLRQYQEFATRPIDIDGYRALFEASTLHKNRATIGNGKHLYIWSASSDREPVGLLERHSIAANPPALDVVPSKLFFEAAHQLSVSTNGSQDSIIS